MWTTIALEVNIFWKKLKGLQATKISQKIFLEHYTSWYYCIGLFDFMLKGKLYTNLFYPSQREENDKITLKYSQ